MATYRSVTLSLPEAQRLADLHSVIWDFQRCRDMCDTISESSESSTISSVLIDALATAIPIVYARPFNGGVRSRIDAATTSFDRAELWLHESILHMRSKFTAHSINGMERQQVRVWLNPEESGERRINSVNIAQSRLASLAPSIYQEIGAICVKVIEWLEKEAAAEASRMPAIILEQYSLEEIYALESAGLTPSDSLDRAHRGRSRK